MVEFVDHPSVKVIAEKTCDDVFDLVPVDVGYIRKILDTLDPHKTVGCDKISQRLLRLSSPVITEPVTRLINYLLFIYYLLFNQLFYYQSSMANSLEKQ